MEWGCCNNKNERDEKYIKCTTCGKHFHYACLFLKESSVKCGVNKDWQCPTCLNVGPKALKKDSTPIRNVTTSRGNKRQAVASPSPPASLNDESEIRAIIKDIIRVEFEEMLAQFKQTMVITINKELESFKSEVREIAESMTFFNAKFEEFENQQRASREIVQQLQTENAALKSTIGDLLGRVNTVEQQSRSNNFEVQCLPESKNENLYSIVTQLGKAVNCDIKEIDILHCTRIAKLSPSNPRPRSVVVQLSSPRLRDQILASVIKYNRDNPQDKLHSGHMGFSGRKSPIYVVEHLSPTNKALHAATRIRAKEKNYKYVWVRNGKIFVRKTDETQYMLIKNRDCLSKII